MADMVTGHHDGGVDLVTCSPDGESRGLLARAGDLFPMNPAGHVLAASSALPTPWRPWGLRWLRVPRPRAGKHEGPTSVTTGGDGQGPDTAEDLQAD
jgi:hypothetical protein